jgi:hypothetical protein
MIIFDHLVLSWLLMFTSLWMVAGVYVDGWAHNHVIDTIETFFTPWHLMLYSGFFASALVIFLSWWLGLRKGLSPKMALPSGYGLSAVGVMVFALGGAGDAFWHTLFGVEGDVDALLSPTHLVLALGAVLIVAGPLRAAYRQKMAPKGLFNWLPVIMSVTQVLAVMMFMSQYSSPISHPWAEFDQKPVAASVEQSEFFGQAMGIGGILIFSALLTGLCLILLRRFKTPFGAFMMMIGLTTFGIAFMQDNFQYIGAGVVAGLLIDFLVLEVKPWLHESWRRRTVAFMIPALYFACYFAVVMFTGGTWWTVHFWTGSIVLAGFTGLLLSYLERAPGGGGNF